MFRPPHVEEGIYTEWDAEGLPVKDKEGKEISKAQGKKMKKAWDAQVKAHDEWKALALTGA